MSCWPSRPATLDARPSGQQPNAIVQCRSAHHLRAGACRRGSAACPALVAPGCRRSSCVDYRVGARALSPVPAVMEVLGHGGIGSRGMETGAGTVPRYFALALVSSFMLALLTVAVLARTPLDRARPAGTMTQDRSLKVQVARRLFFLIDPQRRSGNMTLLVNPVLTKELRSRRFGRSHWALRFTALCAILSLGLSLVAFQGALAWGSGAIGGALLLLQTTLLLLFVPSLASGLISAEREGGTWQLLRMTPLSVGVILRGKLMSVAWPLILLMAGTLPGYIVMATMEPDQFARSQRVLACLGAMALFAVLAMPPPAASSAPRRWRRRRAMGLLSAFVSLRCWSGSGGTLRSVTTPWRWRWPSVPWPPQCMRPAFRASPPTKYSP